MAKNESENDIPIIDDGLTLVDVVFISGQNNAVDCSHYEYIPKIVSQKKCDKYLLGAVDIYHYDSAFEIDLGHYFAAEFKQFLTK